MRTSFRPPTKLVLALALLIGFGSATFEASLAHTDDGCAVELHCFACRWAFASTAIVAPPVLPPTPVETAVRVESVVPSVVRALDLIESTSRAPPAPSHPVT